MERLAYYVLFIIFAAPAEIVLNLFFGVAVNDAEMAWRPFSHALFYLYAFILTSETLFRLSHHPGAITTPGLRVFLNISSYGVLFLFVLHYVGTIFWRIERGDDVSATWVLQILVLIFSVAGSVISFGAINEANRGPAQAVAQ